MSNHFRQHATELVKKFKAKARVEFSDNDEELLTQMLIAAMAAEVQGATEKMFSVINELRRDVGKPELGL